MRNFVLTPVGNFLKMLVVLFKDNVKTKKYSVIKYFYFRELLKGQISLWKKIRIKGRNDFYWKIEIWDYSYIAWNCLILWNEKFWVKIWRFCSIASEVSFLAFNDHNQQKLTTYPPSSWTIILGKNLENWESIVVWNDVWIWKNAIILKWVMVWTGAIIWAWAVVTKDVPAYAVVWWNPAKIIKYRFDEQTIKFLLESERWNWNIEKIRANYNLEFLDK